jgi:hypothetical protein
LQNKHRTNDSDQQLQLQDEVCKPLPRVCTIEGVDRDCLALVPWELK